MRILILASAVGRFGEGSTGGVSRYAAALAGALERVGAAVTVLVPEGSTVPLGIAFEEVPGAFQASAATAERDAHPVPANSLLGNMVAYAFAHLGAFDRVVNLNHDYLPVFATGFFAGKLYHIPNLTSSDQATDLLIRQRYEQSPEHFAAISNFQADKLGLTGAPVLWFGMLAQARPAGRAADAPLFWSGRITPEKGLEFAAEIAARAGRKLMVAGHIENPDYFAKVIRAHGAVIDHRGYLGLAELIRLSSSAAAMLQTQSWEEALGLTTIEALATQTPVIAFDRGANAEIIRQGVNGFVVPPGDLDGTVAAIGNLASLDLNHLSRDFEARFSVDAFQQRVCGWLAVPPQT